MWLRQSTASQEIKLGPFLDSTDFNTQETGLTIANTDIKLTKGGATTEVNKNSGGATHVAGGRYSAVLDATDTNTLGIIEVDVHVAGALAVHRTYMILPAVIYDSLVLGTDNLPVDVLEISGDSTAADNLELQFDTTGLTGDTFPSTQAQLSNITSTGSAVNTSPGSYVLTTGTQSSGTVADTVALDGVKHEHTDTAGVLDLYYEFNIGGGIPSTVRITGLLNNNNDDLEVHCYDWIAAAFVQVGTLAGQNNTSNNTVNDYALFTAMVGVGVDRGKVRVRFTDGAFTMTSSTLRVDQIFVSYSATSEGYDGFVWYDSSASNTNTVVGVDGTSRNPVSTPAAVVTLSAALNLNRIHVAPGSTYALASTYSNYLFAGDGKWILTLGGQDISSTTFIGANVSGTGIGSAPAFFKDSEIGTCTLVPFIADHCGLGGTITFSAAGNYEITSCHSSIAGSTTPIIDTGAAVANVNLSIPDYAQGIEIRNLNSTGTDEFSISGMGQIIYAASSSGTVNQRGDWKVNNAGGVTITTDDNSSNISATLADTADMQPKIGAPASDISADIAAVKVDTAATVSDTNELQADWANGGRLDVILDARMAEASINTTGGAVDVVTTNTDMLTTAAILASGDADGFSIEEVLKLLLSVSTGVLSGVDTNTVVIKAADGSKTRITATVDAIGNRIAVVRDVTG